MSTEELATSPFALPPRAVAARLRLQLRAVLALADRAEADMAVDGDAARAHLQTLADTHRRSCSQATASALAGIEALVAAVGRAPDRQRLPALVTVDDVDFPLPEFVTTPRSLPAVQPIVVQIDSEVFATTFATVFADVIEARMAGWGDGPRPGPPEPTTLRTPLKHAKHLDVFLLVVATLILLVILFSWLA